MVLCACCVVMFCFRVLMVLFSMFHVCVSFLFAGFCSFVCVDFVFESSCAYCVVCVRMPWLFVFRCCLLLF